MKKKSLKSIISIVLAIVLIVQILPISAIYAASVNFTDIDLGTVSVKDVYLLTNNQFVSTSDVQTGTGKGYKLSESNQSATAKNVYVGDNTYNNTAYSGNGSVNIDLNGVVKTLSLLQVNTVAKGNYDVNLSVSKDSKISTLVLEKNAKLNIDLSADLEIGNIELASSSELNITASNDNFTISGDVTGTGSITLSGDSISVNNMTVGSFYANKSDININGKTITATDNLSVTSSKISNAAFVGYGDAAQGNKTFTFAGNSNIVSNIDALGVMPNGIATVFVEGVNTISNSSNTNYYFDYAVNYKYNNNELTKEDSWVDSYRVKYTGTISSAQSSILGYHEVGGKYITSADITLPEYTVEGYNYVGWKIDGSDDVYTSIPSTSNSVLDFNVSLKIGTATLSCDLGFDPNEGTNDDYKNMQRVYKTTVEWNSNVALQRPVRFGYLFNGWKVTTGSRHNVYNDSYTVALADADKSDNSYSVNLETQWTAKTFPLRFLITGADVNQIKVKVGSKTYDSIAEFANTFSNVIWNATDQYLQFENVIYGETVEEYFDRMGYSDIPELIDTRSGKDKVEFAGWATPNGSFVSPEMTFTVGSVFDSRSSDESLKEYETKISATPVVLTSSWGTAKYKLTVDVVSGWDVLVDGEVQTQSVVSKLFSAVTQNAQMSLSVPVGSTVTFRTASSSKSNFSLWNFTDGFVPSESAYSASAQYLTYTATMPSKNVNATFSDVTNLHIDLAQSNITMQQNVTLPSGRTVDGFWYGIDMVESTYDSMTVNAMTPAFQQSADAAEHAGEYFYIWNFTDALRVTTCNEATTNQLTLVNAITTYLKDCNMVATDSFRDKAIGLNLDGKAYITGNVDLREYGNIIIDRTVTNYIPTLIVDGSNTVACISTDKFYSDFQHYNTINVYGRSGKAWDTLTLGTILGSFAVDIRYMTIHQYEKGGEYTDFQAVVAATRSHGDSSYQSRMMYCTLDTPDRLWCGTYNTNFDSDEMDFLGIPKDSQYRMGMPYFNNCDVHIYGDIYFDYTFTVYGSTSMIIEGNLMTTSQYYTHQATINTTGYLIVKGNRAEFSNMKMQKGTLICNTMSVSQASEFIGGTVITNVLSERAAVNNVSEKNADGYPFARKVGDASGTYIYKFRGANVYLLGHYSTVSNGNYDPLLDQTETTLTEGNPIKPITERYLNGGTYTDAELSDAVTAAATDAKECIALGKTEYISGSSTIVRSVQISGGSINAAGNITFYNDTTVSGGTIVSKGSVASKRDLFITGGTVNAPEVGNAYNTTRSEDGIVRWAQTSITGGKLTTDRIGALTSTIRDVEAKSYVSIAKTVDVAPLNGSNVTVCSDLKVNSHLSDGLTQPSDDTFPKNVRYFNSNYQSGAELGGQLSLSETDNTTTVNFASPQATDGGDAGWALDSLSGTIVQYIDNSGYPNGDTASNIVYSSFKSIELYAVKNNNTLTIRAGENYISQPLVTDSDNRTKELVFTNGSADVKSGSTVSFQVPAAMKDKVIVNYYDDSKVLYNACTSKPEASLDGTTYIFSFKMPRSATEIWISDYFDLYLNHYPVTFTADGFATEYGTLSEGGNYTFDATRNFSYQGSIRLSEEGATTVRRNALFTPGGSQSYYDEPIYFSKGSLTTNMIHFTKDFDNLSDGAQGRKIILSNLIQTYTEQASPQTILDKGAQVRLGINGHVGLYTVQVPQTANIEIYGLNEESKTGLELPDTLLLRGYQNYTLGNNTGACGNITLTDLFLTQVNSSAGGIGCSYSYKTDANLIMRNCARVSNGFYSSTWIAQGMHDVTLDHCYFYIAQGSWPGSIIENCHNVTLTNGTEYTLKYGAQYTAYSPFTATRSSKAQFKDAVFTIKDSSMQILTNYGTLNGITHSFDWMYDVVVEGSGSLTTDRYLSLDKLNVKDSAAVKVGDDSHNGYLFCSDITVDDNATVDAGFIAVSGFYTVVDANVTPSFRQGAKNEDAWRKEVADGTHIRDGGTLTVNGGTVNADYFVGGDVNGAITVNGGTLNSPRIGTLGGYLGILGTMPQTDTEWCLFYEKVPTAGQAAVVTVNGGTVNVLDGGYLGGMNSSVYNLGGSINLSNNAVIGLSDSHLKTLTDYYLSNGDDISNHTLTNINVAITGGSVEAADDINAKINTPYGSTLISGTDTKVKIANILADGGTIQIKGASTAYENPYTGGESSQYKSDRVGVWVTDTLSAQTLSITSSAQVFAKNAYAVVDSNGVGRLTVTESGLYSEAYGEKGIKRNSEDKTYNDTPNALLQTVFGTHMVTVTYNLNPQGEMFDYDVANVVNDNILNYTVTATQTTITMKDASCEGYYFKGWYNNAECTGNAVTSLNTTIANDLTLYAKWEKITVQFVVFMDKNSTSYYDDSEFEGNNSWAKSDNPEGYYATKLVSVKYGDRIISTNGLNLIDYSTNTLGVTELEIAESDYAYNGAINVSSVVTKELAEHYRKKLSTDAPIVKLYVKRVQKRYALVTFLLNKKDGKPIDAAYANNATQLQANIGVSEPLSTLNDFVDKNATGNSKGIIQANATGYTFVGWNTDKDADMNTTTGWINDDSSFTANTTVYAIWQANTYLIEFNAGEGSWVTKGNTTPAVGSAEVKKLNYYWIYDTPISDDTSFWLKDQETHDYMSNLPYAWKEGSKFDVSSGWHYSIFSPDDTLIEGVISNTTELTQLAISALDTAVGDPNENPTQVALQLTAEYSRVEVKYNLNGGKWTEAGTSLVQNPNYNDALEGYTKNDVTADSSTNITVKSVGENGNSYYVADTTAAYFATDSKYVDDDYRNTLSKKGYTFYGWYDSKSAADSLSDTSKSIGTTPRFNDISLYAGWQANDYVVNINNKDSGKNYDYTSFSNVNAIKDVKVKVGEEINVSNWPDRSGDWYAYNSNSSSSLEENAKRFFLGATFAPLDPGSTDSSNSDGYDTYINYAQAVTSMINDATLYQNHSGSTEGTVFFLPDDNSYSNDVKVSYGSNYSVADYPQGSTIEMYAVYRERSLVFVERYIDPNGNVQQTVKYSDAWNNWSNYPEKYGKNGNSDITRQGYSLIGWYVNGITTSATPYPTSSDVYDKLKAGFKSSAEDIGTYDIMVYTVYAAQVNRDVELSSKADPTDDNLPSDAYLMPSSMQNGVLSVLLDNLDKNLNIVSKSELESHKYDLEWTQGSKTYNSDNTIALTVTASKDNESKTMDCGSDLTDSLLNFEKEVEAGWQIMFTLYHSKVITENNEYTFDLTANFVKSNGDNTLKDQFIKNHLIIKLQPSIYTVNYTVALPEAQSKLNISDWGYFEASSNTDADAVTKQVKLAYNSALTDKMPVIEGYSNTASWAYDRHSASTANAYTKLNMSVSEANNGVINVSTSYTANTYKLFADSDTLSNWTVTYTDGALSNTETVLSSSKVDVKYHSAIKFVSKTNGVSASPEFVTLTLSDGSKVTEIKLPEYATAQNGNYNFLMPAMDVTASYVTIETLYLDDGTISITPNGYTHAKTTGTITKTWPGDYLILQNASNNSSKATANVLNLSGDLSGRTIQLGDLNISSNNSINLADSPVTKSELTLNYNNSVSTLNIKNVNASNDSELSIDTGLATGTNASVTISPAVGIAGIGSNSKAQPNGKINVSNTNLSIYMPAGSSASGIGSASTDVEDTGKSIELSNCVLSLSEGSDTQIYSGAWIGGNNVANVKLDNVTVNRLSDKHMAGPTVVDADDVIINNSKIGSSQYAVFDPIYAKSTLTINNSEIYQNIQDNIVSSKASSPLTTSNGKININNSIVNSIKTGYTSAVSDLYEGVLYINDSESDVYIAGVQILEVSNGDITVDSATYNQGGTTHNTSSNRNYLLLEECNKPSVAPNLTVNGLGSNNKITVKYPTKGDDTYSSSNGVYLGKLTLNTDVNIQLDSNLFVGSTSTVKSGKSLTVDADTVHNPAVNFTSADTVFANESGISYIQNGGALNSTSDFGNGNINVTLSGVDAKVNDLVANNLTVTDNSYIQAASTTGVIGSKPASTDDASNVTDVVIKDSTVNAKTVGALGEYDKTFTNVSISNSSINATVVEDDYRLTYDKSNSNVNTDSLSKVLRVTTVYSNNDVQSTTYLPEYGVPANPTGDNSLFYSWYINWCNDKTSQDSVRKALTTGDIPAGLKEKTTLTSDTVNNVIAKDSISNSDGTNTLVVHAWIKATGNVNIAKGRNFVTTDKFDSTAVTIQNNSAWTVKITSTGTFVDNRDYLVSFANSLPQGTKLTLTVPSANDVNKYYYYSVVDNNTSSVKFTDFCKMGTSDKFDQSVFDEFADNDSETFLLSADFRYTDDATATNEKVSVSLIPSADSSDVFTIGDASYSFSKVSKATIVANSANNSVTISSLPNDSGNLSGKKLYLKATLTDSNNNNISAKYDVKASFASVSGKWTSKNEVLFELGEYGSIDTSVLSGKYSFENLENGKYIIKWSLVACDDNDFNKLDALISNEATVSYNVDIGENTPYMSVSADNDNRVIIAGNSKQVTFNYTTDSDSVKVFVEKQTNLCRFADMGTNSYVTYSITPDSAKTDGMNTGKVTVNFNSNVEEGSYRIRFSMDDSSTEDDCYFTFVVKSEK